MSKRNRLTILWFLIAALALSLVGCAASSLETMAEPPAGMPAEEPAMEEGYRGEGEIADSAGGVAQAVERIVIKNANLTIVVADPPETLERIMQLADEMGGYVVSANQYNTRLDSGVEAPRASVTIRVPADRLNEALERIESESDRDPLNKVVESQDITREYTDLRSRLRNLENTEAQLTEIMEEANKTEDVLSVYNRLVDIREQIEVIQGQIQYYEESAALSAVRVEILPNEAVQPISIAGWEPAGVARSAVQALVDTLQFLVNAAIWVGIYLLPVLLLLFVLVFLPLRFIWRRLRRRRPQPPVVPEAEPGS